MPVHLAQINALEEDDPETWSALDSGAFVVAKSNIPFSHLEQEIKKLKGHNEIVGVEWSSFSTASLKTSRSSVKTEHYQFSGEISLRSVLNSQKLQYVT